MFQICCKNDLKCFRITEFHHHLSAHSARRCIFCQYAVFPSYDADGIEFFTPSLTALKNAVLSAQFVGVYAAFSILHPVYTLPFFANNAAPTLNPE